MSISGMEMKPRHDRVLVSEPDARLRSGICGLLQRLGHRTSGQASTLEEASALAARLRFDLLIVGLPDPDARRLALLRSVVDSHQLRSVVLAPLPDTAAIRQIAAAGAGSILARPPREADLVAALEAGRCQWRRLERLQQRLQELEKGLSQSEALQRAIHLLCRRFRLEPAAALDRLREQSHRLGRPLDELAAAVVLEHQVSSADPA